MKIDNLHQEHDADAPYADSLVLDAGGMNINHGGEPIAYVSFEGLDPFEIAFHAMPDDWEPHEGMDGGPLGLTQEELLENEIAMALKALGIMKGWERK